MLELELLPFHLGEGRFFYRDISEGCAT